MSAGPSYGMPHNYAGGEGAGCGFFMIAGFVAGVLVLPAYAIYNSVGSHQTHPKGVTIEQILAPYRPMTPPFVDGHSFSFNNQDLELCSGDYSMNGPDAVLGSLVCGKRIVVEAPPTTQAG